MQKKTRSVQAQLATKRSLFAGKTTRVAEAVAEAGDVASCIYRSRLSEPASPGKLTAGLHSKKSSSGYSYLPRFGRSKQGILVAMSPSGTVDTVAQ